MAVAKDGRMTISSHFSGNSVSDGHLTMPCTGGSWPLSGRFGKTFCQFGQYYASDDWFLMVDGYLLIWFFNIYQDGCWRTSFIIAPGVQQNVDPSLFIQSAGIFISINGYHSWSIHISICLITIFIITSSLLASSGPPQRMLSPRRRHCPEAEAGEAVKDALRPGDHGTVNS